ncbi:MAG: stage III sporulation protein AF [Lachnospiraceae bacterium]|nr:stage III sporulation protein AF [Lachnospiraceae bacterium]
MIEGILSWVFNIAVYLILITLVLQLLPERFKKYFNFYTGILLMLIIINPITKLLKLDTSIVSQFEKAAMQFELDEISGEIKMTEGIMEEILIDEYNQIIKSGVTEIIKEYGYTLNDLEVEWRLDEEDDAYGSIGGMNVILREKRTGMSSSKTVEINPVVIGDKTPELTEYEKAQIVEIKNKLAGFYNLSEAHIIITIQE